MLYDLPKVFMIEMLKTWPTICKSLHSLFKLEPHHRGDNVIRIKKR